MEIQTHSTTHEYTPQKETTWRSLYLWLTKGTGNIGTGDCIASVSGQSMAAAWDGKINIEETVGGFVLGGGLQGRSSQETIKIETMELVQRSYIG